MIERHPRRSAGLIPSRLAQWYPCANIKDSVTARGFIALQVHGIAQDADKNEAPKVRWRNLKLTDLTRRQHL